MTLSVLAETADLAEDYLIFYLLLWLGVTNVTTETAKTQSERIVQLFNSSEHNQ